MRRLLSIAFLLITILAAHSSLRAQSKIYQHDTTVKVYAWGKELELAWCGGFNNPQFTMGDLNNDGRQDLVVFEDGHGISTFINTGIPGHPRYRYAPEYALNFPPCYTFAVLADYNCDNIPDLFEGHSSFVVYKGYYNSSNQLCFHYYDELYFNNDLLFPGTNYCFNNPGDIPSIVDVDNDGDLDIVAYDISGGTMNYYKNMRVELGLPCDSIHIDLKDRCWGKVYQGFERTHTLAYTCNNAGLQRDAGKKTHQGNTPCLFDWDMDGDYDYLDGSVSFNEMTFLKNGRIENGGVDSMVFQDTLWQTGGHRIDIPTWPAAYNVDIDQDGKKDLLIAPTAGNASENYKCIWYYQNLSTPGVPDWQFRSDSFLIDKTIDLGTAAMPTLFDYDKDGKPDLFIGSDGYRQSSGLLRSRISYFRNTSTPGNPSFTLQTTDFLGIDSYNFRGAAPTIGDVDHDGKADLIIGHTNGTLTFFKNMATSDAVQPDWQLSQLQLKDMNGTVINVDGNAAPFVYDMDKDGKKDLIIGNLYGTIVYYQDVSTVPGSIKLKMVNDQLGDAIADPILNIGNFSTPFIGKIDSIGTDYLLMGSNSGNIYRFTGFQGGDITTPYTMLNDQYSFIDSTYNVYHNAGTIYNTYGNHRSSVTVGDIDGSGSYSMIVGNSKGGVEFYKNKAYTVGIPSIVEEGHINLYPNPAADQLHISWSGIVDPSVYISVYDMAGRLLQHTVASASGYSVINTAALAPGVYVCLLQSSSRKYYSKFTIVR